MKVSFIYWEAPWNMAQAKYDEKYPHYALLLKENSYDDCIVLFFTHERLMFLTSISRIKTGFVELAEVEIPDEVYESAFKYIQAKDTLAEFTDEFLELVKKHREGIDKVDDVIEGAITDPNNQIKNLLRRMSDGAIEQPFPRSKS